MNIGINARHLIENKLEGIGWYSFEVLRRLVLLRPQDNFYLFYDRKTKPLVESANVKNVIVNTPLDIDRSCGIGNVGLTNMSPSKMEDLLFQKYKIFTVAIDYANVKGCRISPNIFTTTKELDSFVEAVKELSLV